MPNDPVLARIEHKVRVPTLIAARADRTAFPPIRSTFVCRATSETVFFDI